MLKRLLFSILTIVAACMAVVGMVFVLAWATVWPNANDASFTLELLGFVLATLSCVWLAWYFNTWLTSEDRGEAQLRGCERCGCDAPTLKVSLNRHVCVLVLVFHRSEGGHFCKVCIEEYFWSFTPITAVAGWWGPLSVIITPIVLANNTYVYLRSRFLP